MCLVIMKKESFVQNRDIAFLPSIIVLSVMVQINAICNKSKKIQRYQERKLKMKTNQTKTQFRHILHKEKNYTLPRYPRTLKEEVLCRHV